MRRAQRLRERRDFGAVFRRGKPYGSELLTLRALRTDRTESRFGFATGRRVGNAVTRNRLRRRLREAVRSLAIAPGWDVVVGARRSAGTSDYWRLRDELRQLLRRAGVLEGSTETRS